MIQVGVITIHRHINVGCYLQAYGLQEAIIKRGYGCEIIDYCYPHTSNWFSAPRIRKLLTKPVKRLFCGNAFDESEALFKKFLVNQFNLSDRSYKTARELKDNPPVYDLYCVGSDQVWHPTMGVSMDPTFYGDFVPLDKPLVSYASSFGVSRIPEEYQSFYNHHLNRFSMLSVREMAGVEIIEKLIGRKAEMVVDPTLLLDETDWTPKMPVHTFNEPYILCYGSPYPNVYLEPLALHVQKQTGLKIIHLFGLPWQKFDRRIKHIFNIGPFEFLTWVKNASLVLTTSFHGTIFSINFKTPFYSVYAEEENGLRQKNILKCLKMEDRLVKVGSEFPLNSFFEVDFENAHLRLARLRTRSQYYLERMLSIAG